MKLDAYIDDYSDRADSWLVKKGFTRADIVSGRDAWTVAHGAGITGHAYALSRGIVDAHIQTALQKVFPNVIFKAAKRY